MDINIRFTLFWIFTYRIHVTCHSLSACQCMVYLLPSGGDIPPGTGNDAEIWGYYHILRAKRNTIHGKSTLIFSGGKVKSTMRIRIYHRAMYVTNYAGYTYFKNDSGLFTYKTSNGKSDSIYLGLNRVIHNFRGNPYGGRTGGGLCYVTIDFFT